jgi:hypothetical protein
MNRYWFYQLPLAARRGEAEGVAALLRLADGLANPLPGLGEGPMGAIQGGMVEPAISLVRKPQSLADLRQMIVEAHRRGRVLVVKRNKDF